MTPLPRVALALVLAAYLVPLAVPAPLMEDDEGLHAAIAQEMVERGDWTVPRLLGEPFLDKPILYFWLQAVSIAAFGPRSSRCGCRARWWRWPASPPPAGWPA